jgi:hypothetical protein
LPGIVYRPIQALIGRENQAGRVPLVVKNNVCFTIALNDEALVAGIEVQFHGVLLTLENN